LAFGANRCVQAANDAPEEGGTAPLADSVVRAGTNAVFAAEEFFKATLNNPHTKRAYGRAVAPFLAWCEHQGVETPPSHSGPGR
jgi:hypothetical protein